MSIALAVPLGSRHLLKKWTQTKTIDGNKVYADTHGIIHNFCG
jgi:hypothetical protein